jgi:hypothetical protein
MSEPGTVTCDALPMRVVFGAGALGSSPLRSAAPACAGYRSCTTSCPTSSAAPSLTCCTPSPSTRAALQPAGDAGRGLRRRRALGRSPSRRPTFHGAGSRASLRDLGIPEDGIETVANWRPKVPMPTRGRLVREGTHHPTRGSRAVPRSPSRVPDGGSLVNRGRSAVRPQPLCRVVAAVFVDLMRGLRFSLGSSAR